jgi:tetratricopeptide (TPR) repeat protein
VGEDQGGVPLTRRGGRLRGSRTATAILLLAALTACLYAQTLDDEWHFDDSSELSWPGVRDLHPVVHPAHYRGALPLWLWALNYRWSGEDGWSYHLVNVLIHFLNSVLVYLLAGRLAGTRPDHADARSRMAAATAAVVFCAHPLATQAVTYVTQRSTSLAALFVLASLLAWSDLRRAPTGTRAILAAAVTVLAFALGTLSKHVAFTVPVLIAAQEALFRSPRARREAVAAAGVLLLVAGWQAAPYIPRVERLARAAPEEMVVPNSTPYAQIVAPRYARADYARSQPQAVLRYLRLIVLPVGQNLDPDVAPATRIDARVMGAGAVILALLAAAWSLRRRSPAASFGIVIFLVTLLPTTSFVPSRDLVNEHRAYLPLAGFALAAGAAGGAIRARRGGPARLLPFALALLLGGLTIKRNAVWDTEIYLWSDTAAKSPGKARPHVNLGLALQAAGRLPEAEARYASALRVHPDHPIALNNLGNVRRAQGDLEEAETLFRAALSAAPSYLEPHVNLANVAMDRGEPAAAEALYREVLAGDSTSVVARYNLAKSLEVQGRASEAAAEYERLTAARPRDARYANDLGCARLAAGDVEGAVRELRRAVEISRDGAVPWYNLALALEAAGDPTEAAAAFREAERRDPRLRRNAAP